MTLIGIGPFWLYRSIFFLFSHTSKVKQADETLRRIYNRNCKTLSINRAGKHHRGFYPSSCPHNCSLLSSNTLDTHILIYQSIKLGGFFFLHFKFLQSLNSGCPNFCWITFEMYHVVGCPWINASASINISAIYVGPIYFNFDVAIFAVGVLLAFVLAKSIKWLEHTLCSAISL